MNTKVWAVLKDRTTKPVEGCDVCDVSNHMEAERYWSISDKSAELTNKHNYPLQSSKDKWPLTNKNTELSNENNDPLQPSKEGPVTKKKITK